ncbi:diacylglycerol kinase [Prescottella equi]|jgi:diacylglycerol kinase (ATP)|uniref:Diacylglycerol kinase n=3 Tax=Rhodococcus hoagii TaxID=43767 RepID=E9SVF4_RHOHA|nr:diacylglycerol kinase [Prescottella equi]MCD7051998.1 diacylglycerol kinase [Rhodococcus sp. BH2-1]GBF14953.1 diacylglycerol kinase [Rhodococcus sp. Br-6]EGD26288.1 diacylglycerol kinase [Prescottella equi ATCC 33707]ERN45973.1 diacylglycerol kinase [Prescottella equi NBRC 101255 = C 7]MBM4470919.1 diacylglycerol kinase [Prescottella equi]
MTRSVTVLTNPAAGSGHASWASAAAVTRLRERGVAVTEIEGSSAEEALDLARKAVAEGTDALVAAGGDGVVSIAWQALAQTGTPLGIVPGGTGNDHARLFHIPVDDPVKAADIVAAGEVATVDLARAGERWFGTVLSSGFDALVTDRANQMRWPKGPMRYNLAMIVELAQLKPIPYRIVLDDRTIELDATMVSVGNGTSYGGGMLITPHAKLDDGLLDVTVVKSGGRFKLVRLFPTVYKGTHVELDEVETYRTRKLRLETGIPVTSYADGEFVGQLPIDVEAVPGAGRVIVGAPLG